MGRRAIYWWNNLANLLATITCTIPRGFAPTPSGQSYKTENACEADIYASISQWKEGDARTKQHPWFHGPPKFASQLTNAMLWMPWSMYRKKKWPLTSWILLYFCKCNPYNLRLHNSQSSDAATAKIVCVNVYPDVPTIGPHIEVTSCT